MRVHVIGFDKYQIANVAGKVHVAHKTVGTGVFCYWSAE